MSTSRPSLHLLGAFPCAPASAGVTVTPVFNDKENLNSEKDLSLKLFQNNNFSESDIKFLDLAALERAAELAEAELNLNTSKNKGAAADSGGAGGSSSDTNSDIK